MPRRAGAFVLILAAAACGELPTNVTQPGSPAFSQSQDFLPDRYIVEFALTVADPGAVAQALTSAAGGTLHFVYRAALLGFAATIPAPAVEGIRRNPLVLSVVPDGIATTQASGSQSGATWGIDRIDQRNLPRDNTYNWNTSGQGVDAYVIDTGIRITHTDFSGRASIGADYVGDGQNGNDCHGHGTHVAGTIGGETWGVAKDVNLFAVRVLGCGGSGSWAGVIAGVDWVTANHSGPSVANMSLGGGANSLVDQAVRNSIAAGVVYSIAAGNANADACNSTPARTLEAITVGATTSTDARSSFSNWGPCVDFFAPGSSITSAWNTSDIATNTISGTSMAAPHTAGVAALYLEANPNASAQSVRDALFNATTKDIVTNALSANDHLLYSLVTGAPPPGNDPPTANFTFSCNELTCNFTDTSTDGDGTIATRSWNFGDGNSSTATNPTHTYGSAGTRTVTLTVTDNDGAGDSESKSVTVSVTPPPSGITLTGTGTKNRGTITSVLNWSGASATVDIYRDGAFLTSTTGSSYTDSKRGGSSVSFQVCNAGTQVCSNTLVITP
jgi:subtilisin family serine protease